MYVCMCVCVCVCVCVYIRLHVCSLVSTHHSPTDVGSVLKLAMAFNGSLFPMIAENIKVHSHVECISNDLPCIFIEDVMSFHWGCGFFPLGCGVFPLGVWHISIGGVVSFHWGCGIFPLGVWCLSIGGWCLSIVIGYVNKKEHEMACVDT